MRTAGLNNGVRALFEELAVVDSPKSQGDKTDGTAIAEAFACIEKCCREMLLHDGFGEMSVETKILKRGQKEVIVHFGKQYRFVVDVQDRAG